MSTTDSELMIAVRAIKEMKWDTAAASPRLTQVCDAPGIRRIFDTVVTGILVRYGLTPHEKQELPEIVRANVVRIIQCGRCESPTAVARSISKGLRWRTEEAYVDHGPRNESLRSKTRQYNKYIARAKRARVELSDQAVARLVGKSTADMAALRQARSVYYMKPGLRESRVKRIEGMYQQESEPRKRPRSVPQDDFEKMQRNAFLQGMTRKPGSSHQR